VANKLKLKRPAGKLHARNLHARNLEHSTPFQSVTATYIYIRCENRSLIQGLYEENFECLNYTHRLLQALRIGFQDRIEVLQQHPRWGGIVLQVLVFFAVMMRDYMYIIIKQHNTKPYRVRATSIRRTGQDSRASIICFHVFGPSTFFNHSFIVFWKRTAHRWLVLPIPRSVSGLIPSCTPRRFHIAATGVRSFSNSFCPGKFTKNCQDGKAVIL